MREPQEYMIEAIARQMCREDIDCCLLPDDLTELGHDFDPSLAEQVYYRPDGGRVCLAAAWMLYYDSAAEMMLTEFHQEVIRRGFRKYHKYFVGGNG
jgi:hypothetical protein